MAITIPTSPVTSYARDIRMAILKDPCQFEVSFPTKADRLMGKKDETVEGPFWGTMSGFRASRTYVTYDEKGTASKHGFVLVALRTLVDNDGEVHSIPADVFAVGRTVKLVGRPERYKVTSNPEDGPVIEVNLDMEG